METEFIGQSVELVGSYGGDETIEGAARTCTQTEVGESPTLFVQRLLRMGHMSPTEFGYADFRVECDRGIQQELTRHRHFSFLVEATRAVDYRRKPLRFVTKPTEEMDVPEACVECLEEYCALGARLYESWLNAGVPRDYVRKFFTLALASRLRMGGNLRTWYEMLPLRLSKAAHPEIREVARMVKSKLAGISKAMFGE